MNYGKTIKKLRGDQNQMEFAELVGISQTYLSQLENDHKTPSIEVLNKISEVADMPIQVAIFETLEEKDVKPHLRKAFKTLKPAIDDLITAFFK